ncbi:MULTISPECIES: hypothetical protein [Pseudomonas syringae group]|uniref:Uncharacterized protein n=1 Tax=Pseudomonas syringae group genomosp. 3 TaxID=251701 RepID=A0ABD6V857_9PSED|nr:MULTISPECIES: hypothetical protein [Pseudomonas syringae group]POD67198.1 hypothetical protein BKM07_17940 [Pseudomonas syringae group genomosp. 3]
MNVLVVPMRNKGVALVHGERSRYKPIKGNVVMRAQHCDHLGRHANIAWLETGMPREPKPLPDLLDVTLATMAHNGFVLSGIEYIDGCAYAQSWWCRHA